MLQWHTSTRSSRISYKYLLIFQKSSVPFLSPSADMTFIREPRGITRKREVNLCHLCTNKLNFFLERQSAIKKVNKTLNQNTNIPFIIPFSYFANSKQGLLSLYSEHNLLFSSRDGNLNLIFNIKKIFSYQKFNIYLVLENNVIINGH